MDNKIMTFSTLFNLIELDYEESFFKKIGKLFLNAMYDWPIENERIEIFINETKEYFGNPMTTEKIENKKLNTKNQNSWRQEAGSSLHELIKLSEKELNETEFEKVIKKILNHYEIEYSKVDFIAELEYLTIEQGGRKTVAKSGYRPEVKFDFAKNTTSGKQTFVNKEFVNPGEKVIAKIKVLSPSFLKNQLYEGIEFKFCEGTHIIGNGKVTKIINSNLEKTSR